MNSKQKYPKVTIIFPNYNGGQEPLDCLQSIKNLAYPKDKIETIVIDNNSTDGSFEAIKKEFKSTKLIKNTKNLGFAKAINQGILKSKTPFLFITNDDIVFEKNSLKNLITFARLDKKAGILSGKIYLKSDKKKLSADGYKINKWTGNITIYNQPQKIKEPEWVPGCAMLIKKVLVAKIGLFDTDFSHSFEDVDYCLRARLANFKVVYVPTAKFWHGDGKTSNKNLKLKHYHWYQGKLRYTLKNLPLINALSIFMFQSAIIPFKTIYNRDYRLIPYLKAIIWNVKNLRKTLSYRK